MNGISQPKRLNDLGKQNFDGCKPYDLALEKYHEYEISLLKAAHGYVATILAGNIPEFRRSGLFRGDIVFDILDDRSINAFAAHRDGHDHILLNSGLIISLFMLYARLAQFPSAFTWLGIPNAGSSLPAPLRVLPLSIDELIAETYRATSDGYAITPVIPEIESRYEFASFLWRCSLLFILFHESGHLAHGHVDYCQNILRAKRFGEIGDLMRGWRSLLPRAVKGEIWFELRRAQERQADRFAVIATFLPLFIRMVEPPPYLASVSERGFNRFPYAWGFALSTLFTVLAFLEGTVAYDRRGTTHPNPFERFANAAFTPALLMQNYRSESRPELGAEIMSAWHDVDALFGLAFEGIFRGFFSVEKPIIPISVDIVTRTYQHEAQWKKYDRTVALIKAKASLQFQVTI